jgi:hypothetical protein
MVSYQDKVRTKLQTKVFDRLGKTVTLINKSSVVYNIRGEEEGATETPSSITVVPYSTFSPFENHQPFGSLSEGETDMAIPYDVSFALNDQITMEGDDYIIKNMSPNYLPGNVVWIVRLKKEQA